MKHQRHVSLFAAIMAVALPFSTAFADEASVAAAEKLIDTMDMEKLLNESLEVAFDQQMAQFAQMGMPAAGITELKNEMIAFAKEVLSWDEVRPEYVRIYSEAFTAGELDEMNAFYQTPTGKKAMSLMPQLMQQGMELGQKKMQARMPELQQRIAPIMQKHMAPQ